MTPTDRIAAAWRQATAQRSPRERMILAWGGALSLVLIAIFGVVMPLQDAQRRLQRSVVVERQQLATMQAVQREMKTLSAIAKREAPPRGKALRDALDSSARLQLMPSTLELRLDGDNQVVVTLVGVNQAKLLHWIDATLQAQRLRLDAAHLRRKDAAIVAELRFSAPEA
ncbi:MAG TPA: type II secretion system protein GspM [Rhodocyclaceae bacterium]|nr:type II secretion system protein GspM [Rhodocyclaceae bacterium]